MGLAANVAECTVKIFYWKTVRNSSVGRSKWWDTKMGLRELVLICGLDHIAIRHGKTFRSLLHDNDP